MLFHLYRRDGLIFAHVKQSSLILYFVKSDGLQIQFPDSTVAHGPIIYGQILHIDSRCPLGSARNVCRCFTFGKLYAHRNVKIIQNLEALTHGTLCRLLFGSCGLIKRSPYKA